MAQLEVQSGSALGIDKVELVRTSNRAPNVHR